MKSDSSTASGGGTLREIRLVGGPEHGATWEMAGVDGAFGDGDELRVRGHVYLVDVVAGVGVCTSADERKRS
jgi:hypothetical protein